MSGQPGACNYEVSQQPTSKLRRGNFGENNNLKRCEKQKPQHQPAPMPNTAKECDRDSDQAKLHGSKLNPNQRLPIFSSPFCPPCLPLSPLVSLCLPWPPRLMVPGEWECWSAGHLTSPRSSSVQQLWGSSHPERLPTPLDPAHPSQGYPR